MELLGSAGLLVLVALFAAVGGVLGGYAANLLSSGKVKAIREARRIVELSPELLKQLSGIVVNFVEGLKALGVLKANIK